MSDEVIQPDEVDGHAVVTPDDSDFQPKLEAPQFVERDGQGFSWEQMLTMSLQLAKSPLLPQVYRNKPENVMVAALMAQELGWGVTTAMRFIHVIEGKPTVSPEGMLALVRRAGHSVQGEANERVAELRGKRADTGDELWVRFTMTDASRARLVNKDNWKKYPDAMLWARALGMLCRRLFSDVLLGMAYTPDEMGATTDEKGEPIVVDSRERPPSIDWPALGWKNEQAFLAARMETKVIIDALPRKSRDAVRRVTGPAPDLADYTMGVWTNRHQAVIDEAKRLGLLDENDRLKPHPTPDETEPPADPQVVEPDAPAELSPEEQAAEDAADEEWRAEALGLPAGDSLFEADTQ